MRYGYTYHILSFMTLTYLVLIRYRVISSRVEYP